MNIAELFVSIGIKGADKTTKALKETQDGLKGIAATSLETKAALIGAMYALERLFASSGRTGTDLTNFTATTGVAAKTLQQYQYAARQVGMSNQEMEGTFRSLQNTMTQQALGKAQVEGLGLVSALSAHAGQGEITHDRVADFARHPEKLIQTLQAAYAQGIKEGYDPGILAAAVKSFGTGDAGLAAISRQAFTPETLNKAPTYSDEEIAQLDKARAGWANLANTIEMAVGHFNAKYGKDLVDGITQVVDAVMSIADALVFAGDKLHVFEAFKGALKLIAEGLRELPALVKSVGVEFSKVISPEDLKALQSTIASIGKIFFTSIKEHGPEIIAQFKGLFVEVGKFSALLNELSENVGGVDALSTSLNAVVAVLEAMVEALTRAIAGWRMLIDLARGVSGPDIEGGLTDVAGMFGTKGAPGSAPVLPPRPQAGSALSPDGFINELMKSAPAPLPGSAPIAPNVIPFAPRAVLPSVAPVPSAGKQQSISVQQTLNFQHDGKDDVGRIRESHQDAVRRAYRQGSAQAQGT